MANKNDTQPQNEETPVNSYMTPQMAETIKVLIGEAPLRVKDFGNVIPPIFTVLNNIMQGKFIVTDHPNAPKPEGGEKQ